VWLVEPYGPSNRGIVQIPYKPEFAWQRDLAERLMREDRDALRKLAR
jgi:hypothetical protein